MASPRITCTLGPPNLVPFALVAGDTEEVVAKGVPEAAAITAFSARAADFGAQFNAAAAALVAAAGRIEAASHVVFVDAGDALRNTEDYVEAIESTPIDAEGVETGRELRLTNIRAQTRRPTIETFVGEIDANGEPAWAGPVLPGAAFVPSDEPNAAPSADAGADATVRVGETFRRTGTDADADGSIVAREWTIDGERVSIRATVEFVASEPGSHELAYRVTDDRDESAADAMTLTVEPAVVSDYDALVTRPLRAVRQVIANTEARTRTHVSCTRPVFTATGDRLVVGYGQRGTTYPTVYDVIDLSGRVLSSDLRAERDVMPGWISPIEAFGIWDAVDIQKLVRTDWTIDSQHFYGRVTPTATIGDGRGSISRDDRYIVARYAGSSRSADALECVRLDQNLVVGSMSVPSGYLWCSITPNGAHVLVGTSAGIDRYTRGFGARTTLSTATDHGDCVVGESRSMSFVQGGASPRIVDIDTGTTTLIDTGGAAAVGTVSGVSLVPGYVCACWDVGGAGREIVTMELADGSEMWNRRVVWASLAGTEPRPWATALPVPSPDGRRILYRAADVPGSGDVHLYLLER